MTRSCLFSNNRGPWNAHGERTCLYGLQAPPLASVTLFRVSHTATGNMFRFTIFMHVRKIGPQPSMIGPQLSKFHDS